MSTHSNPDSLDDLVLRAGSDIRSPLLRTLVDLYLQKPTHTAEEAQHFTELALRLLDQADVDTRIAMARRLACYPAVPAAIVDRLANDMPDVAALVRPAGSGAATEHENHPPAGERVAPAELSDLFFAASTAERRLILTNLAYAPGPVAAAFAGDAREAARQLETAALAHNPDAFMHALERWLGITPALARRIVNDPLGEPIVVAAKVLRLAPDVLQRILLFANPAIGRSISRVYELAMLFDTIDAEAAHALLGIWRAADPRPGARPAPSSAQPDAADRSARRTPASQATVTQRKSTGTSQRVASGKR